MNETSVRQDWCPVHGNVKVRRVSLFQGANGIEWWECPQCGNAAKRPKVGAGEDDAILDSPGPLHSRATEELRARNFQRINDPRAPAADSRDVCTTCGEQQNAAGYCTNKQCSRHGRRNDYLTAADSRDTEAQDVGQRFAFVRACRVIAKMHNNRNCACEFCCYLVDTGYWYEGWGKRAASVPEGTKDG